MSTIVLVPGSFAPLHLYDNFIASLEKRGIPCVIVDIPSIGRRPTGPHNMTDDANAISKVVLELLDSGKDVVLMAHSYGGIPTTQSLEKVSTKVRAQQGKKGVDKVIYMASVILQPGQSNLALFGGAAGPDYFTVNEDYMSVDPVGNAPATFSDLPPDEALHWAKMFPEHATPSFKENLTYAGYNDVDVNYIVCTEDKVIPVEAQRGWIAMIEESSGNEVRAKELKVGHAPTVSHTDLVADTVKDFLG